MDIIIGSSRARNLGKGFSTFDVETWFQPGGKICQMHKLVDDHIMFHLPGYIYPLEKNFLYVVCGICDITCKVKNYRENYQEIIYLQDPVENVSGMKVDIQNLAKYAQQNSLIPVISTIIPVHLEKANLYLLDNGKTSCLRHSHEYHSMNEQILSVCQDINSFIKEFNETNNVNTPDLCRTVYHNKTNGKKYFKHSQLYDGVHPDHDLTNRLNKVIKLTIENNRKSN